MKTLALGLALALTAPAAASSPKPPVLQRFIARYSPRTATTFYVATATDPQGSSVTYTWTLVASCGYLTSPNGKGPSNEYQHGPAARRPNGCQKQDETAAILTVRITDRQGCSIEYQQGARDERVHERPPTRPLTCIAAAQAKSKGFPVGLVLFLIILAAGAIGFLLARRRTPAPVPSKWEPVAEPGWAQPVAEAEPVPQKPPAREEPVFVLGSGTGGEDASQWPSLEPRPAPPPTNGSSDPIRRALKRFRPRPVPSPAPEPEPVLAAAPAEPLVAPETPCTDGEVRNESNDVVAHDTVLAGLVFARVRSGNEIVRESELPPHTPGDLARLLDGISVLPQAPVEVEVEIPLRLVTVVSTHREICRDGHWTGDIRSTTHDGPERTERLRAQVGARADLDAFIQGMLTRRLGSLVESRRRLESTLAKTR